jgi:hypothetical protein
MQEADGMQQAKVITVCIVPEDAQRSEIVARADEISVNEVFRRAPLHYFTAINLAIGSLVTGVATSAVRVGREKRPSAG